MMGCLLSRDGLLLICIKYTSFKSALSTIKFIIFAFNVS
nr:MAG TPA: hypothetical protein [Caudoviricetes sp.]